MRPALAMLIMACAATSADGVEPGRLNVEQLQARLGSCDSQVVRKAADELMSDPRALQQPVLLYLAALGLHSSGFEEDAAFLTLAARLRGKRQSIVRGGDAASVYGLYDSLIGVPLTVLVEANPELAARSAARALKWDRATPDRSRDEASSKGPDVARKLADVEESVAKLASGPTARSIGGDADRIVASAKLQLAERRARACSPGTLDPASLYDSKKRIKREAERFVAAHPFVVSSAGGTIGAVSLATTSTAGDELLPSRATVSVEGRDAKLFAEVDIETRISESRQLEHVEFTLVCLTKLWEGERDASCLDACAGDPAALRPQ